MPDQQGGQIREPVENVLSEFDARKNMLESFCIKTKSLIEDSLLDAGFRYQSVQARVKKSDKLRYKYLDEKKNYSKLDDITDQAAIRVITYYEDEVDRVAEVVKKEFTVIPEQSVDKRETEPDRFGYYALNYVCKYLERRASDVQFKKFANLRFEIQVTSILRHAWSEIEHEWYDLKEAYPDDIKRRFYRQAALLEIAESEFLNLRNLKTSYKRSVDVQVETEVRDLPLDLVSMKSFIKTEPLVFKLDESIASILGVSAKTDDLRDRVIANRLQAAALAGLVTVQDLRDSIKKHQTAVIEYVNSCKDLWKVGPNNQLAGGASIYHLASMLIASQGEKPLVEAMEMLGVQANWNVHSQVVAAQQILSKYPR
jgi:putative GTP pyrophosphokinase